MKWPFRRTRKWVATATALLILVWWPMSRWWFLYLKLPGDRSIASSSGNVTASNDLPPTADQFIVPPGIYFQEHFMQQSGMSWWFTHFKRTSKYGTIEFVVMPLWAPLVVILIPVVVMWRTDLLALRRRRAGFCHSCGYDRRGRADTLPCPECGNCRAVQ